MRNRSAAEKWPATEVELWPIDKLIPYARNARAHSEIQISQIAASIREWGWTMPCLVDEAGTLISGHGRVLAARQLGLSKVPVMLARGWSDAKKRAYAIADNRLPLNATWDLEMLAVELDDLRDAGADLKLLGFDPQELNDLIGTPNLGPSPDTSPQLSGSLRYLVLIECRDEQHQGEILGQLASQGFKCRPSIS